MSISKDIIRDLLPVYVAGEVSTDTRVLVEQSLASEADLRAEAAELGTVPVADVAPSASLELLSLQRTQLLLRRRAFLVGFGYLMATLPLALTGRDWGPVWSIDAAAGLRLHQFHTWFEMDPPQSLFRE